MAGETGETEQMVKLGKLGRSIPGLIIIGVVSCVFFTLYAEQYLTRFRHVRKRLTADQLLSDQSREAAGSSADDAAGLLRAELQALRPENERLKSENGDQLNQRANRSKESFAVIPKGGNSNHTGHVNLNPTFKRPHQTLTPKSLVSLSM